LGTWKSVNRKSRRFFRKKSRHRAPTSSPASESAVLQPVSPHTREYVSAGWKTELREKLETATWKAIDAALPY
jgi:hypothetical protein